MILYYNSPIIINIIMMIIMCVNFIRPVSDIVSDIRKGGILSERSWNESIYVYIETISMYIFIDFIILKKNKET